MADQQSGFAVLAQKKPVEEHMHEESWGGGWAVWAFVWFIIIVAIVFFLIVAFGGEWLEGSSSDESGHGRGKGCNNNWGRALLWAVVVALIVLVLIWLLSCLGGYRSHRAC
jgi:ABC-type Fe3+ transport system permease subunit